MNAFYEVLKWQMLAVAVGLWPGSGARAADLAADFSTARLLYEERRYAEARDIFRKLAAEQADSVELNFYLGRLALWFDDEREALDRLERAARAAPDEARIQNALGDAFGLVAQKAGLWAKLGWARKCLGAYERAVELDPRKSAYRWSLLGYHCVAPRIAGGGNDKAVLQAQAIAKADPMEGRIAVATILLSERRHAAAFALFDDVLRENADHFLALYQVGRCAALSGEQLRRGEEALRRCLGLVPPSGEGMPTMAGVHHRLGNILEKSGDRAGAGEHYAAARRLHPDFRGDKDGLRN